MFEYGDAILVCPVVEHIADEEDRDSLRVIIVPRRLRIKKVMAFLRIQNVSLCQPPRARSRTLELYAARFECVGHILLPVL
jgi:hypothetical protein